ncbi:MAG TPA: LamG-like jellyroll fold domain-containing protein [Cytophagaceae bacterium]
MKIKSFAFLAALSLQISSSFAQPLVGYFSLNDNFIDQSKTAINGVSESGKAPKPVQDRVGSNNSAYLFDGVDDYIDATENTRNITNTLTVSAWVKTSSSKFRQFVVAKYDYYLDHGFHLGIVGANDPNYKEGAVFLGGRDGSDSYSLAISNRTNLNDGKWHHLCGIVDKNSWQVWVDGKLESETKSTTLSPNLAVSTPLYIGDLPNVNEGGPFAGVIDEVELYNTVVKPIGVSTPCRPVGIFNLDNNYNDLSFIKGNGSSLPNFTPVSAIGVTGKENTAFRFDGKDDYITFGTDNRGVTNHVTVSAWVKTSSHKFRQFVVGKYEYSSSAGYNLAIIGENDPNFPDGTAVFSGRDGSSVQYVIASSKRTKLNDGVWHHICGIVENNKWQVWVDGVLEGEARSTTSSPNLSVSSQLYVGHLLGNDPNIDGAFDGTIDNVEIYNCAYTPERIVKEHPGPPCKAVGIFNLDNNYNDLSYNKSNGSSLAASTPVPSIGIFGEANTAYRFDGNDDYITFGTDNRGVTNNVTVSAWFKTSSHKFRQFVVGKYEYNSLAGYNLAIIGANDPNFADGTAVFGGRDGSATTYMVASSKTSKLNDGGWHHICGIVEKNKWQIWVDGVLEGEATSLTTNPDISVSTQLYVGHLLGNDPTINGAFDGVIDNVEIYNCTYTPERIGNELPAVITAIRSATERSQFLIFPTMLTDKINISTDLNSYTVTLFSCDGRVIGTYDNDPRTIDVSGLDNGLYILNILEKSTGNITNKKVLKY